MCNIRAGVLASYTYVTECQTNTCADNQIKGISLHLILCHTVYSTDENNDLKEVMYSGTTFMHCHNLYMLYIDRSLNSSLLQN